MPIDLATIAAGTGGFVILGRDGSDYSGTSVASAGDFNGDGFDDLIIGALGGDAAGNSKSLAGESYVVFGRAAGFTAAVDLAAIAAGSGGFVIYGADANDRSGRSVASAGDINGDGFDDLLIGASLGDGANNATTDAGESYVVFGKAGGLGAAIDLAAVAAGSGGFVIRGEDALDQSGLSVASAGDVNGDGFDDLLIGAPYADAAGNAKPDAGGSYVVFGKSGGFGAAVDLAAIAAGSGGFVIHGEESFDRAGISVAGAGDINGDGLADLIIGANLGNGRNNAADDAGDSYIVFGRTSGFGPALDLATVAAGTGGFVIHGQDPGDRSGGSVASAGDINGDGFGDLIIGAAFADGAGNLRPNAGDSYVLFGTGAGFGSAVDLAAVAAGTGGFVIQGMDPGDYSGFSVAGAGDVNGDGFDDLIIGAFLADGALNTKANAGESYLVFGKAAWTGAPVALNEVAFGVGGFAIFGQDAGDQSGRSVAAAGDLDGDGFDDLIIGAWVADAANNLKPGAGDSYVVLGRDFTASVTHAGTNAADTLTGSAGADIMIGGQGNDTLAGGSGADVLRGGAGNDVLAGGAGADRIDGGSGADTADYTSSTDAVVVDLLASLAGGGDASGDTLDGIESITGSAFDDQLTGNRGVNVLAGLGGNDTLAGGDGNDTLAGGLGSDLMSGGAGNDTAQFAGNRAAYVITRNPGSGEFNVVGPDGSDRVSGVELLRFADSTTALASLFTDAGIVNGFGAARYLASNLDLLNAFGPDLNAGVTHFINSGFNEGRGFSAFDTFRYLASNTDVLAVYGPSPDGAAEHYVLYGRGEGRATTSFDGYRYLASNLDLLDFYGPNAAAATEHYVRWGFGEGRPTNSFDAYRYLASNADLLAFYGADATAATEHFVRFGHGEGRPVNSFNSAQYLANYADLAAVYGSDQSAAAMHYVNFGRFEGRTDLQLVFIGTDNGDTLTGNATYNTLAGGLGNDNLTGAGGADSFVFNTALNAVSNRDTIADFAPGVDRILLDDAVFTALAGVTLTAGNLVSNANPSAGDPDDFLLYNTGSGTISYDPDGSGALPATAFVKLTGAPVITAADFSVV